MFTEFDTSSVRIGIATTSGTLLVKTGLACSSFNETRNERKKGKG